MVLSAMLDNSPISTIISNIVKKQGRNYMTYKQHRAHIRRYHIIFTFVMATLLVLGVSFHFFWSTLLGAGCGSTFYIISSCWIYKREQKARAKLIKEAEETRQQIMSIESQSNLLTPDNLITHNKNIQAFNKLAKSLGVPQITKNKEATW